MTQHILAIGSPAHWSAFLRTATGAVGTFALNDIYLAQQVLPARFRANAVWPGNKIIYNLAQNFANTGAPIWWPTLAGLPDQSSGAVGSLINYPADETSAMCRPRPPVGNFL